MVPAQRKGTPAMPVTVKPEEVPTFSRETVSKYADIFKYQTDLLADPKRATKEAVAYNAEDGVTQENWGQIASGLRAVAKALGVKLAIVYKAGEVHKSEEPDPEDPKKKVTVERYPDNLLYVKHNGAYVALTDEQVAARKAKRRQNKIDKLVTQYVTEGMTKDNATKRATAEVDANPTN